MKLKLAGPTRVARRRVTPRSTNSLPKAQLLRDRAAVAEHRTRSRPKTWLLPAWLPQCIKSYARAMIARPAVLEEAICDDAELRARFERLTTDPKMEFVWTQLEAELKGFGLPGSLGNPVGESIMRGYLIRAITADHDLNFWNSAPSSQEQRGTLQQIHLLAAKLSALLDMPQDDKYTPWNSLDTAIASLRSAPASDQELFHCLAERARGRYWSRTEVVASTTLEKTSGNKRASFHSLPAIVFLGDLPLQLNGLAILAKLATAKPEALTYRKRKTKHLRRMLYVISLGRYLEGLGLRARAPKEREGGFHLYRIIATTTNVALGLIERDEISADTARKLARETT